MNLEIYIRPLLGGTLIGLSASILLLFTGRVFGVSGIIAGVLKPRKFDTAWKIAIIGGLLSAGLILEVFFNGVSFSTDRSLLTFAIAGLFVGFGTQLGSGCTSGHGVCGMSRLSPRSILATIVFVLSGILTVTAIRTLGIPV